MIMQWYEHLVFVFLILSKPGIILNNISLTTRSVVVTVINVFQRRFDIFYPMGALSSYTRLQSVPRSLESFQLKRLKTYQISTVCCGNRKWRIMTIDTHNTLQCHKCVTRLSRGMWVTRGLSRMLCYISAMNSW